MGVTYKDRVKWTDQVVTDLKEYWPLTLRQIFYQLVSHLLIPNTGQQYKALSAALSKARKEGLIPWRAIEDRTRPLYGSIGWDSPHAFLEYHLKHLADLYERDLMADQEYYIELFVEKQALITPFERAAGRYHVLVNMGRGYSSTTVLKKMADRFIRREASRYHPLILAFSDFDPSGLDLVDNLSRQFEDFGLQAEVERIALTKEQIEEHSLPHDPDALKITDSRAARFIELHGKYAVELDALAPATLEDLVHKAIEERLDPDMFERRVRVEEEEREALADKVAEWLS